MSDSVTPVQLDGELSFATVPRYLAHSDQLLDGGELDMSRVTQADSAGLALLLELTRRQHARNGAQLKLIGAAAGIVRLAEFFGLEEVLRFQDSTTNAVLPGGRG